MTQCDSSEMIGHDAGEADESRLCRSSEQGDVGANTSRRAQEESVQLMLQSTQFCFQRERLYICLSIYHSKGIDRHYLATDLIDWL